MSLVVQAVGHKCFLLSVFCGIGLLNKLQQYLFRKITRMSDNNANIYEPYCPSSNYMYINLISVKILKQNYSYCVYLTVET